MSKAFTRESDGDFGVEEVSSLRPRLPPGARNLITRAGADRLKERLNELMGKKQALAIGDHGSGSGIEADQREIETAIRKLQQTLDAVIVPEVLADQDRVAFGAAITIRRATGEEESYRIVGVEEADPESGAISWISPLARALLSRRAGEKALFRAPTGDEEVTLLTVHFPSR